MKHTRDLVLKLLYKTATASMLPKYGSRSCLTNFDNKKYFPPFDF